VSGAFLVKFYNAWFTEGFENKDLQEARALLEEFEPAYDAFRRSRPKTTVSIY